MKKYQTLEQVESTEGKAARFARDVLEDDDLADDLEDDSPESYASRKRIVITNPQERRTNTVANGDTKAEPQKTCDQVQQILEDAYQPEASREDLAAAIGESLGVLSGDTDEDEDDTDDDDQD